ncbi:hypothetical protein [Acetobacterium wieringae]|uniref:hypothetical protein n=1 Tax=Acetobacterium wieringae TaxID=52694 RepID=UPI0031583AEE
MGKVKFKHESGMEPYLIHNGKRYQVHQIEFDDGWGYQLQSTDQWIKLKKSISPNLLVQRFLKGKRYQIGPIGYLYNAYFYDGLLFGANDREGVVKIMPMPVCLSKTFKRQLDCIKFAEKYIEENYMDQQVSLLG